MMVSFVGLPIILGSIGVEYSARTPSMLVL